MKLTAEEREALRKSAQERRKETCRKARDRIKNVVSCRSLLSQYLADGDPIFLDELQEEMKKLVPTDFRYFQKAIEAVERLHSVVTDQYYILGASSVVTE